MHRSIHLEIDPSLADFPIENLKCVRQGYRKCASCFSQEMVRGFLTKQVIRAGTWMVPLLRRSSRRLPAPRPLPHQRFPPGSSSSSRSSRDSRSSRCRCGHSSSNPWLGTTIWGPTLAAPTSFAQCLLRGHKATPFAERCISHFRSSRSSPKLQGCRLLLLQSIRCTLQSSRCMHRPPLSMALA